MIINPNLYDVDLDEETPDGEKVWSEEYPREWSSSPDHLADEAYPTYSIRCDHCRETTGDNETPKQAGYEAATMGFIVDADGDVFCRRCKENFNAEHEEN